MKVNIWIKREEALSGNISEYYTRYPEYKDYVQVSITTDEFARLEDKETGRSNENYTYPEFVDKHYNEKEDEWLVKQYNRNRDAKDHVKSKDEIPYIYEKNPDSGKVYRRKSGDYNSKRESVRVGLGERVYSGDKDLKQLKKEMEEKTGSDFMTWFHKLTKIEQTTLAAFYND